jgi:N-acyl-L-homoserine lactone synthetase
MEDLTVKTFYPGQADPSDIVKICHFRFKEYGAEGWLPPMLPALKALELDRDIYDPGVLAYVVVFDGQGEIVATQRLIQFPSTFMVFGEYGQILSPSEVLEEHGAGEVSRLAVRKEYRQKPVGSAFPMQTVHHLLAREFYKICQSRGIETIYTATQKEATNAFRTLGFPLQKIREIQLRNGDTIEMVKFHWADFMSGNDGSKMSDWYQAAS